MTQKKRNRTRGMSPHVSLDNLSFDVEDQKEEQNAIVFPSAVPVTTEPIQQVEQRPRFQGPDIDFDNGLHSQGEAKPSSAPVAAAAPVSPVKSELSAAKIENAEKIKADALKKQTDQEVKAVKNSEKLNKTIEELIKVLKGPSGASGGSGTAGTPVNIDRDKKGLGDTLKGAVSAAIKGKTSPLTDLTSKKGLLGLGAAKFGGDPNSILGSVFGALHEREAKKQDEVNRKEEFHTGFTTGTDTGRDLISAKKQQALAAIKKANPKLSDAQADRLATVEADKQARGVTGKIYEAKAEKETKLTELNQRQTALKAKGENFDLSDVDKQKQIDLKGAIGQLSTSGKFSESDVEVRQRRVTGLLGDIGAPVPGETPKEAEGRKNEIVEALKEISAMTAEELNYSRKSYDLMKEEKTTDKTQDAANTEKEADQVQQKAMTEKASPEKNKGLMERAKQVMDKKSGILGKGKDIVGKAGKIKNMVSAATEEGGLLSTAGRWIGGALSGIGAGTLAAGAASATGIAGAGQAIFGENGVINGGSGHNFISDAVGSGDWFEPQASKDYGKKPVATTKANPARAAELKARQSIMRPTPAVRVPEPAIAEKVNKDIKPIIDDRAASVEKFKMQKPVVVNVPATQAPVINNNSSTTNVVRPAIRNQEPSYNASLRKNFI